MAGLQQGCCRTPELQLNCCSVTVAQACQHVCVCVVLVTVCTVASRSLPHCMCPAQSVQHSPAVHASGVVCSYMLVLCSVPLPCGCTIPHLCSRGSFTARGKQALTVPATAAATPTATSGAPCCALLCAACLAVCRLKSAVGYPSFVHKCLALLHGLEPCCQCQCAAVVQEQVLY